MARNAETALLLNMEATLRKFERQMNKAPRVAGRSARRIEGRFTQMSRKMDQVGARGARGLGMIGVRAGATVAPLALMGLGLQQIVSNGDKLTLLGGRLEAITGSAELAASGVEGISEIMVETGSSIETASSAFTRFTQAGKSIGATQGEVLTLTETLLKLGRVGGGTTQELNAGAIQLGQALASGQLRGDELRSVLENLPVVAEALADALGVNIGQLREMAEAGELTSRKVFDALLSKADEANQKFGDMPLTVEVASGRMAAAWARFTASIDDSLGLSRALAGVLDDVAAKLDRASLKGAGLVSAQIDEASAVLDDPLFADDEAARAQAEKRLRRLEEVKAVYLRNAAAMERAERQRAEEEAKGQAETEFNITRANQARERELELLGKAERAIRRAGESAEEAFRERAPGATEEQIKNIRAFAEETERLKQARSGSSGRTQLSVEERLSEVYVDQLQALAHRRELVGKTAAEQARLNAEYAARNSLIAAALDKNRQVSSETLFAIEAQVEKIGELTEATYEAEEAERARQDALKDSAREAERFQREAEQANERLVEGLIQATIHAQSFEDALKNIAIQLIEIAASDFFKALMGGQTSGSVFGSLFSDLFSSAPLPGSAGASGALRVTPGATGFSGGGQVHGSGGPTSDSIPAMLSDGEFVVRAASARKNLALLHRINRSGSAAPRFANGGMVGRSASAISVAGPSVRVIINNNSAATVKTNQRSNGDGVDIFAQIDDTMAGVIADPGSRTNEVLRQMSDVAGLERR